MVIAALVACAVLAPRAGRAQEQASGREHVGVRVGGLVTSGGLHDKYGDGWQMSLFFTERIAPWFFLDIRIGALYLGDLKDEELDDELTGVQDLGSAMRILYFSVGPMVSTSLGQNYTGYATAGVGVYSVSMVFDSGITAFDFSDQDAGFSGGVGLSRRLSTSWSVEANATVHYVLVSQTPRDIYYSFTAGAGSPLLLDIALGATLDLH